MDMYIEPLAYRPEVALHSFSKLPSKPCHFTFESWVFRFFRPEGAGVVGALYFPGHSVAIKKKQEGNAQMSHKKL